MIVAAAMIHEGKLVKAPKPARHAHIIYNLALAGAKTPVVGIQGFVDEEGRFLDRIKAAKHALECGQIEKLGWPPKLFTEDLW